MTDRYDGKPFLRLLDSYILDAIGHLPADQDATLTSMEPKLRQAFGVSGHWRDMVSSQMQFPEGMAGAVREVWDKGRPRYVEAHGEEPDPVEFTRIFVDTKFPR